MVNNQRSNIFPSSTGNWPGALSALPFISLLDTRVTYPFIHFTLHQHFVKNFNCAINMVRYIFSYAPAAMRRYELRAISVAAQLEHSACARPARRQGTPHSHLPWCRTEKVYDVISITIALLIYINSPLTTNFGDRACVVSIYDLRANQCRWAGKRTAQFTESVNSSK